MMRNLGLQESKGEMTLLSVGKPFARARFSWGRAGAGSAGEEQEQEPFWHRKLEQPVVDPAAEPISTEGNSGAGADGGFSGPAAVEYQVGDFSRCCHRLAPRSVPEASSGELSMHEVEDPDWL